MPYLGVPDGPLSAYLQGRDRNEEAGTKDAVAAATLAGMLQKMQHEKIAQQQQQTLLQALASGDESALAALPGGQDILAKRQQISSAKSQDAYRQMQVAEIQRKNAIATQQGQAQNALANYVSTPQFKPTADQAPNSPGAVYNNDAEAISAMQEAEKSGTPFTGYVNNPAIAKGLAIKAAPDKVIPEILKQQTPTASQTGATVRAVPRGYLEKQADGKWTFNKTATDKGAVGMTGESSLSGDALTLAADQYLAGDSTAAQGYARSAAMKSAFMNRLAERAKEQGVTGKDLAGMVAEFQGQKAGQRTLGNRQAQIELAATVASKFAPIAIAASENFDRTQFKSLNDIQKAVLSRTSSPELRQFNAANQAIANAYARAISPTGTPTDDTRRHAYDLLDTAFSKGDYKATVNQMMLEIKAELESPTQVRDDMRSRFTGTSEVTAPKIERAVSKSGKPIHTENGQWVYD